MSQLYSMAIQEGMSSLEIAISGSNAKTREAYNAAYSNQARRIAGRNRIGAAQRNLAAIQQDKILTNNQIQIQNTHQQAMTKLSAAVAGVTGSSVDNVKQQVNTNTVFAMQSNERKAEQMSDQFLAEIQGSTASTLGIQDKKISDIGELMTVAGNISLDDYKGLGQKLGMFGG